MSYMVLSCSKDEDYYSNCRKPHPENIMQRIKLVDKDGNWIDGIENAEIELIATDDNWTDPLVDKNNEIIKQIPNYVEARKYSSSGQLQCIELYMRYNKEWEDENGIIHVPDSKFILKINENISLKIEAKHCFNFCRQYMLKSFYLENMHYPQQLDPVSIIVKNVSNQ